ncbi:MAG: YraN family protein [Ruminococcaceae bacterium]|nr:YraN family protein [Oscillospiraceae bacterium]
MYTEQKPSKKWVGQRFEAYTADWLETWGYKILKRNYSAEHKEIDIIAMKQGTICFVEVKSERITNENADRETPPEKITPEKMKNIISGARFYIAELRKNGIDPYEFNYRFDGAGILFDEEYYVKEFKYFRELYKVDEEAFL